MIVLMTERICDMNKSRGLILSMVNNESQELLTVSTQIILFYSPCPKANFLLARVIRRTNLLLVVFCFFAERCLYAKAIRLPDQNCGMDQLIQGIQRKIIYFWPKYPQIPHEGFKKLGLLGYFRGMLLCHRLPIKMLSHSVLQSTAQCWTGGDFLLQRQAAKSSLMKLQKCLLINQLCRYFTSGFPMFPSQSHSLPAGEWRWIFLEGIGWFVFLPETHWLYQQSFIKDGYIS